MRSLDEMQADLFRMRLELTIKCSEALAQARPEEAEGYLNLAGICRDILSLLGEMPGGEEGERRQQRILELTEEMKGYLWTLLFMDGGDDEEERLDSA